MIVRLEYNHQFEQHLSGPWILERRLLKPIFSPPLFSYTFSATLSKSLFIFSFVLAEHRISSYEFNWLLKCDIYFAFCISYNSLDVAKSILLPAIIQKEFWLFVLSKRLNHYDSERYELMSRILKKSYFLYHMQICKHLHFSDNL